LIEEVKKISEKSAKLHPLPSTKVSSQHPLFHSSDRFFSRLFLPVLHSYCPERGVKKNRDLRFRSAAELYPSSCTLCTLQFSFFLWLVMFILLLYVCWYFVCVQVSVLYIKSFNC
jgi:hypothetical protein